MLEFSIGGFGSQTDYVLNVAGEIEYCSGVPCGKEIIHSRPTDHDWKNFREALDGLKVWKWRRRYWNHDAIDGTQWTFKIAYKDKSVRCEGSNAYPATDGSVALRPEGTDPFRALEQALERLRLSGEQGITRAVD